jgi:hypothetical protein
MSEDKSSLNDKTILKRLWNMRHVSLEECLATIKTSPDLQFLLTLGGIWFFVRITLFFIIAIELFSFIGRVFRMVLG